MNEAPPKRVLTSLQAFRGFAACLVLLYHAAPIFSKPEYGNQPSYGKLFYYGGSGVHFFFVLSGSSSSTRIVRILAGRQAFAAISTGA